MTQFNRRDFLNLIKLVPLAFLRSPGAAQHSAANPGQPNFLIVVFDALSAKHMSLYGYPRETTPFLNQLVEKAVVYHHHIAGGNFTSPGTASLLTGTYPWTHRALHTKSEIPASLDIQNIFDLLDSEYHTFSYSHNVLVQIFLYQFQAAINDHTRRSELFLNTISQADKFFERDYYHYSLAENVALWSDEVSSTHLLSRFLFSENLANQRAMDSQFTDFPRGVPNDYFSNFFLEDAITWTQRKLQERSEPFLGYMHYFPPHHLYNTRKEFIDLFDDDYLPPERPRGPFPTLLSDEEILSLRRRYDEYIPYVDAEFARLFTFMEQEGLLENTYLIFTSDHGESFERGVWMHNTELLSEELIRIPLVIWGPGIDRRVDIYENTSCVDVLPTLLHLAGRPGTAQSEGVILPYFDSGHPGVERAVFAVESKRNHVLGKLRQASIAMKKGPYKLAYYYGYTEFEDLFELYHLGEDPEELVDLAPQRPAVYAKLKEELLDRLADENRRWGG